MDGDINVSDAVFLIDHIVFGTAINSDQIALSDLNNDGQLNVIDVVMIIDLINFVFFF